MEIMTARSYTEVHAKLVQGEDFTVKQLVPDLLLGGELMLLDRGTLWGIAERHGYDECTWSGHYHEEDRTVFATFRKENGGVAN